MNESELISVLCVFDDLYESEINMTIASFWDGGFDVKLGDRMNGFKEATSVDSMAEAAEWLKDAAIRHYPDSLFADKYT